MHRCNQTDRGYFSHETLFNNPASVERNWHNAFCPDNPHDISLIRDVNNDLRKSIWIEAFPCTWEGCKSEEEVNEFKKAKDFSLGIITNSRKYQPNKYGNEFL